MKVPFVKYHLTGNEIVYVQDILTKHKTIAGDGEYTKRVQELLETTYGTKKALLTTSGTTALEMAVRLLNLQPGDEVIAPSFTFSSTVNAILLEQNAKLVFADIDEKTLNINPEDIKKKITSKTKALMIVHYAGVACDMGAIMQLAQEHNLLVIEDAAQGIGAKYQDKYLGTIGHFGCLSFHETKNVTCGEGGALFINYDQNQVLDRAEIIREKGTDRSKFLRGEVDKYTWVDIGSSSLPSDILSAILLAQLEQVQAITTKRLYLYNNYITGLKKYEEVNLINLPTVPEYAQHNAHIFYLLCRSEEERNKVLSYLRSEGVGATFHYVALHSSPYGAQLGFKAVNCPVTEIQSKNLLRLPLFPDMTEEEQQFVIQKVSYALENLKTL